MNELEDLRAALRQPAADEPDAVDLDRIMGAGRRIRLHRRLGAGAAGLGTVAVLVAAGVVAQSGPASVRPDQALPSVAAPAAPGAPTTAPAPRPSATARPARTAGTTPPGTRTPAARTPSGRPAAATPLPGLPPDVVMLGGLVRTSTRIGGQELVFFMIEYQPTDRPEVKFGLQAALRAPDGQLTPMVFVFNRDRSPCSPDRPAFQSLYPSIVLDGLRFPSFGYYCGPPARFIATVAGTRIEARQAAPWPARPELRVFWLGVVDVPVNQHPDTLEAVDAAGRSVF